MKELLMAGALLLSPSNTLTTEQYEDDTTTMFVITITPQGSNSTALFGCYPLNPTVDAR